ncbi:MAG TPA: N-acetylmuramoyl-L-alanine amidase [Candidatus Limnocylindria bacterium]|jgi:peptidoglycan hydrolase-like protein with peptidoglycan-binding domain
MRWVLAIPLALAFALAAASPALAAPPPYYPPITYIPAARANYDVGRTAPIVAIVIHETDGSYTSAVNWFQNPRAQVSAHYLVRAYGGGIIQFVAESDTAYHARVANPWSIGIEHEFDPRHAIWHTDAQYRASALLVCAIARRYGIPVDRSHIIGHNEVPGTDHSDPGPTWNWNYYMSLVRNCSQPQRAQAPARLSLRTIEGKGFAPTAGLQPENVSDEVALLQWDLAFLRFIDADEVAGGGHRFGPLTLAAVTAFQQSSGLPADGAYGQATAAALAQSVLSHELGVPGKDLEPETESEDVSALQTALQKLGYMDLVTGYYGEVTSDAVAAFQKDNGIDANGAYGPVTRMALATRLLPPQVLDAVEEVVWTASQCSGTAELVP